MSAHGSFSRDLRAQRPENATRAVFDGLAAAAPGRGGLDTSEMPAARIRGARTGLHLSSPVFLEAFNYPERVACDADLLVFTFTVYAWDNVGVAADYAFQLDNPTRMEPNLIDNYETAFSQTVTPTGSYKALNPLGQLPPSYR